MAADALVLKVREGGRTIGVYVLVATGVNVEGYREVLGLQVTSAKDGAGWLAFFRDLTARGQLAALSHALYSANLMSRTPKSAWGLSQSAPPQRLRTARCCLRPRPVRSSHRSSRGQTARRSSTSGRWAGRHSCVHAIPAITLEADLVEQFT